MRGIRRFKILYVVVLFSFGAINMKCTKASKYRSLVKRELETNIRYDTLLMDIRFGMNKREFFAHCWDLHKKGLVEEGSRNTSVKFGMERNGKSYDINFYPDFHDGKIISMPVEYSYNAFAPWNKKFSLDSLAIEVLQMLKETYGDGFLALDSNDKDKGIAHVRVDGNRRISIYKDINKNHVVVYYFDLLSEIK